METAPAQPERRSATRHRLSLPVTFPGGTGVTRDVSATGLFLLHDRAVPVGQLLALSIALDHADPEGTVYLNCRGRVSRVERVELEPGGTGREEVRGVALAFEDVSVSGDQVASPTLTSVLTRAQARLEAVSGDSLSEDSHSL